MATPHNLDLFFCHALYLIGPGRRRRTEGGCYSTGRGRVCFFVHHRMAQGPDAHHAFGFMG